LSRAKVGDVRKVSSSGRVYYYDQDDIDKRDNTGSYAPSSGSSGGSSSSRITEAEIARLPDMAPNQNFNSNTFSPGYHPIAIGSELFKLNPEVSGFCCHKIIDNGYISNREIFRS
jgi:hypothetical protein